MAEKVRVLVIDDKKVIGDFFDFTLGYLGHKIAVVYNHDAALDKLNKEDFDIVFLDIVMPDKDGVEILKDIRKVRPNLPVVMMSGFSVDEKKKEALSLGIVTCLQKPFDIDSVLKVMREVLKRDI